MTINHVISIMILRGYKMKSIMPLKPFASHKIWGGQLLSKIRNINVAPEQDPLGETWEISAHDDGASFSEEGPLNKIFNLEDIPYLVKFIDTAKNLSVQVHPQDEYAKRVENSKGKSECWIILDAKEGAGIYLGVKPGVDKETFRDAIESKDDLSKFLNFYPVKRGDFFYVPAGTIHAIGEDVFLAEVQQCSDITYRVWDWNRVDEKGNSRELHVQKSLDVIRFDEEFNFPINFKIQNNIFNQDLKLLELNDFELFSYSREDEFKIEVSFEKRVSSILVLSGEVQVTRGGVSESLSQYEAAIFPLEEENSFSVVGKGSFLIIK
ncbi:mannose-6-phosphate isomerase [Halobacteriovorax marinus SJ]|uniref:Mannose-6-phosphate isomerase n=2 Tax=Halobacteriovorax marinus TaxID=97084 RepID=E1WY88_HALMS|nr:mannose-6-phosphate isomerase [Halobacteriovorax marinus SJ]